MLDTIFAETNPGSPSEPAVARIFTAGSALVLLIIYLGSPPAFAANHYYAIDKSVRENSSLQSSTLSVIKGGAAFVEGYDAGGANPTATIRTYKSAPGYKEYGYSESRASVTMAHGAASNVKSSCTWRWDWAGGEVGSLNMTCSARV